MTGKERMKAALSGEGAAEIPVILPCEHLLVRDHWKALTNCPWWYMHEYDISRQVQWRREAYEKLGQDWFFLNSFGSRDDRKNITVENRSDGVFLADKRTGSLQRLYEPEPGGGLKYAENLLGGIKADTPEEIDRLIAVEQFSPDGDENAGRYDMARELLNAFDDLYPAATLMSPIGECFLLWDFEEAMINIMERPEIVDYTCHRFLERTVLQAKKAAAMGASAVFIEDAYSDMISPEHFKRFDTMYNTQLIEEIRALGMKSIFYFAGNPAGKLDLIFGIQADAFSFEESKKNFNIDIEDLAELSKGRFTLLGNLDAIGLLQDGTEEQLRAEIKRQINAGRKNQSRFIMSLGSPVTPDTTIERLRLYRDLAHEYGRVQG